MKGFVTLAVGDGYLQRAAAFALSAKRFGYPTILLYADTDPARFSRLFGRIVGLAHVKSANCSGSPRIWELKQHCYEYSEEFDSCVFVDADSLVIRDPSEMFRLAEGYHIHTPGGRTLGDREKWATPPEFTVREIAARVGVAADAPLHTLNGGFLLWKRSAAAAKWFDDFSRMFHTVLDVYRSATSRQLQVREELCMSLSFAFQKISLPRSDSSIGVWDAQNLMLDIKEQRFECRKGFYWQGHQFHPYIAHFGGQVISPQYRKCVQYLLEAVEQIDLPLFVASPSPPARSVQAQDIVSVRGVPTTKIVSRDVLPTAGHPNVSTALHAPERWPIVSAMRKYNLSHWSTLPKVSCQCITYGRPQLLNEAVESFLRQDYAGEKEMVILNDHPDIVIEPFNHAEVKVFNVGRRFRSIGEKRNACCALCTGKIIFPWDDDDISLPWRISFTLAQMTNLHYFKPDRLWYWDKTKLSARMAVAHAMGAWSREMFDEVRGYPHIQSGQDQAIEDLFAKTGKRKIAPVQVADVFYIYRFSSTGNYHLSAFGYGKGLDEAERHVARHVVPGHYEITPCWKQDYLSLAAAAARTEVVYNSNSPLVYPMDVRSRATVVSVKSTSVNSEKRNTNRYSNQQRAANAVRGMACNQRRFNPTIGQVKPFTQAGVMSSQAAPEIVAQRIMVCRRCDKRRVSLGGVEWCAISGYKVSQKDGERDCLAIYEENLPRWGCKHPLRNVGKGWPLPVVAKVSAKARVAEPDLRSTSSSFSAPTGSQQPNAAVTLPVRPPVGCESTPDKVKDRLLTVPATPSLLFTSSNKPAGLEDLYHNRSCFLICGGPSFGRLDLAKLRQPGILTMGVNNSVKTFRPHLWTCADNPDHFLRSIWLDPAIIKFAPNKHAATCVFDSDRWEYTPKKIAECPATFFYHRNAEFNAAKFLSEQTISWGNDNKHGGARSVMLAAIRLLYYMGVRRIFLLGCDFKMTASYRYHFGQERDPNSVQVNNYVYRVLKERFKQLRPVFEAAGLRICNCNPKSELDAFEKISFDRAIAMSLEEWGNINVATECTAGLYDRPKPQQQPKKLTTTLPTNFKPGLTVITCTRNRPEAFKLLERWMRRQTSKWDQWIVVNDGQQCYEYTLGQEVIARVPVQGEGHPLTANLLAALPRIRHGHIIFVEDDDWIGPTFLETMSAGLKKAPLVGSVPALYYNVATGRWQDMRNRAHASLGQTAIHAKLLPLVAEIAGRGSPQIDTALWHQWKGKKKVIRSKGLHVGIKGMPGERGIGVGHGVDFGKPDAKSGFGTLRRWIGEDVKAYLRPNRSISTLPPNDQTACIITCHNYGRFLARCLDSCLRQTTPFAHVIVVDDASTDNTRHVAAPYVKRGVRYLRTEFRNYSLARNAGYKALPPASHVLFVDADNWLSDGFVELLRRGFVNPNIGACYGNLLHYRDNKVLGLSKSIHAFKEGALEHCNMADACSLMRCEAFEQVGMWSEAGTVMSDWSLWLRFRRMGWKMQFCPDAILNYRIHGQQMSVAWRTDPRKVVEAAPKESALIAVVTLFSGRTWALASYARFLHELQWNRRNIVVVAVDNSGNMEFNRRLNAMLNDSGYVHILVPDATRAVADVSSERFAADPRLRQTHNHQLAVQMARLYAVARQFVPAAATHVWTIEDDIEPAPDALKHLIFGLYRFRQAGMIGGLARSRFGARWIAWDNGNPFEASSPGDYKEATETGFLCALFPRSVWDALAFKPGPGVPAGNVAYDHTACRDIRNMGRKVLISGSVRCKHWQQDGTHV